MYVGYISTNSPNLALIRGWNPSLTSGDLQWVIIYADSESSIVKNARSLKVYVVKIGQVGGALMPF